MSNIPEKSQQQQNDINTLQKKLKAKPLTSVRRVFQNPDIVQTSLLEITNLPM